MSAVAPNRAVAATLLLGLIVTSSWCVASAIPAANGRRLQQLAPTSGVSLSQLQELAGGVTKLSDAVKAALLIVTPSLQSNTQLLSQLQQVATSLDAGQGQLQTFVGALQGEQALLATSSVQTALQGLLSQLEIYLQAFEPQLQTPTPVGGCFTDLETRLVAAISDMVSRLQAAALVFTVPAGSQLQPQTLIISLQNFGVAVSNVNSCDPDLLILLSHDQGVIDAINALAALIKA